MADVELVAASDPVLERAQACAPRACDNARAMLDEDIDILDIATRPESHRDLVCLAAERRLPVIVQKPLAPTLAEAMQIQHVVAASGIPAMVHENWRWQPWHREARCRIDAGAIGPVVGYRFEVRQGDGLGPAPYPNQPYFRDMPRLLIYETLVHHIDTARFLFGEVESVTATLSQRNPVIRGEDSAVLLLRHESGVRGVIDGHRYLDPEPPGPAMGEAVFEGEAGRLRIDARGDLYIGSVLAVPAPPELGYKGDSVYATQRHFLDCLTAGLPSESAVNEYMKTFAVVEAAYQSAGQGVRVRPARLLATNHDAVPADCHAVPSCH